MKKFNYRGSQWHNIEPETNQNLKEKGFIIITRPVSYSIMKKQGGQMVTAIDAKPEDLPKNARLTAEEIVKNY